jgi:cell division protein FtsI/penicillin-binding protein 2
MHRVAITEKAAKALRLLLVILAILFLRILVLATRERSGYLAFARKCQQRTYIETAPRGTIRDRFGLPLAINRIQYNAAICYNDIRQLPRIVYEGKEKVFARRRHIAALAELLAEKLDMPAHDIEDVIHSKASIFPNTPFVIKEDIPEELYYSLRAIERKWPGLATQRATKRQYPQGSVAGDVIGYMGAISQPEYRSIAHRLRELERLVMSWEAGRPEPLPDGYISMSDVYSDLATLREQSYTVNDRVGKGGLEKEYESLLKGRTGLHRFEVGMQGAPLRTLPSQRIATPGTSLHIAISGELQRYAQELLAQRERERLGDGAHLSPFFAGGAIVAMEPHSGEVVALATSHTLDPNDFIQSTKGRMKRLHEWLETNQYKWDIWDGKREVRRGVRLTWDRYIQRTLSEGSAVRSRIEQVPSVEVALQMQEEAIALLRESGAPTMRHLIASGLPAGQLAEAIRSIPSIDDALLFLDLLRLVAPLERFDEASRAAYGALSLTAFREKVQEETRYGSDLRDKAREHFHSGPFQQWRSESFRSFLKEERRKEREEGRAPRPYIDYLHKKEEELFAEYWEERAPHPLFAPCSQRQERTWGRYPSLPYREGFQEMRDLATAFYPREGCGYARSHAYRQAAPIGSLFKVVTGYRALLEEHNKGKADLNPLTIVDTGPPPAPLTAHSQLGEYQSGKPIYRRHNGGQLPRSHKAIGKTRFLEAMQRSSNLYFSLLAGDILPRPTDLVHAAASLGFGEPTGIDMPGEYAGRLPRDMRENKTGLYAFAIGQHAFTATPLQAGSMLAAIANGGKRPVPHIVTKSATLRETPLFTSLGKEHLPFMRAIGLTTPLFTEPLRRSITSTSAPTEVMHHPPVPLPKPVQSYLCNALDAVVWSQEGSAHPYRIRGLYTHPGWYSDYVALRHQLIGKTSTAQRRYKETIDREGTSEMVQDTWFGGIAFRDGSQTWDNAQLVIVVYLQHGDWGKEAAPLAAQIVTKWRRLVKEYEQVDANKIERL